jgi:ribosomal protein L40E
MSAPVQGNQGQPAVCQYCRAEVDPQAFKCSHCGSWVRRPRYWSYKDTVIAAVIAVAALVAIAVWTLDKHGILP